MSNNIIRVCPDKKNPQTGQLHWQNKIYPCALGKGGVISAVEKQEGDGCTPAGMYPLRFLYYRADRGRRPHTKLETKPLKQNHGWCDASDDKNYNCPVTLPYKANAEELWRQDHYYDLIGVIGHNHQPAKPNKGSAIFIHVAREGDNGLMPTRGCIALAKPDLLEVLETLNSDIIIRVHMPQS